MLFLRLSDTSSSSDKDCKSSNGVASSRICWIYRCLVTESIQISLHSEIDPSNVSSDGKQVTCSRDEMYLKLDHLMFPWLRPQYFDIYLLDKNCRPYHVNFTHMIVKTGYGDCKTKADIRNHDVIL